MHSKQQEKQTLQIMNLNSKKTIRLNGFGCNYIQHHHTCTQRLEEHLFIKIVSGVLNVEGVGTFVTGDYVFLPRNFKTNFVRSSTTEEPYEDRYITLSRPQLRKYWTNIAQNCKIPKDILRIENTAVCLQENNNLKSLFQSIEPFIESNENPDPAILSLLMDQAILSLLMANIQIYPTLFDFNESWKIDIMDFLENNFREDLTIQEMSTYTGRSLATFKRDFSKISNLSPMRWLMLRRLEAAKEDIQSGQKTIAEAYMESGFNNRSHFTTAFKREYGITPNEIKVKQ